MFDVGEAVLGKCEVMDIMDYCYIKEEISKFVFKETVVELFTCVAKETA